MSKSQPLFPDLKIKRILAIHIPYDVTVTIEVDYIVYAIDALDVTVVAGKSEELLGAIYIPGRGNIVLHNMTELKREVKSIRNRKSLKTNSNVWEWIIYSTERTVAVFVLVTVITAVSLAVIL